MTIDALKNHIPVDLTQLRAFTDGDKDMEKEFISVFVTQSDKNLQALSCCCIDGKCDAWVEAAHMFKGGAAAIGAKALSNLCSEAQNMPEITAAARTMLFRKIDAEYAKVNDYLRALGSL